MAKARQAKQKQDNSASIKADIRAINSARKAQGSKFASLPLNKTEGLENIENFVSRKYGPQKASYGTKVVALRISRYQATKIANMNKQQAYTYLNTIVQSEAFGGTSIDKTIRKEDITAYGSDTINQLADQDNGFAIEEFKRGQFRGQEFLKRGKLASL